MAALSAESSTLRESPEAVAPLAARATLRLGVSSDDLQTEIATLERYRRPA